MHIYCMLQPQVAPWAAREVGVEEQSINDLQKPDGKPAHPLEAASLVQQKAVAGLGSEVPLIQHMALVQLKLRPLGEVQLCMVHSHAEGRAMLRTGVQCRAAHLIGTAFTLPSAEKCGMHVCTLCDPVVALKFSDTAQGWSESEPAA